MTSCPITSWQIKGETMETVAEFIFLGSKITADGDFSHEIKRCLLLGRKVMTNLDSISKSRDITLLIKFHLVKAVVFPVVMYGCDSLTIKKTEHQSIDPFELWCWRRLLRAPWTTRRFNQSILKEINPEYSLEYSFIHAEAETPMLWPADAKKWFLGKDADARKDWRQEEKEMKEDEMVGWCHRWVWVDSGNLWCAGRPGVLQSMGSQKVGHDWETKLNWTEKFK